MSNNGDSELSKKYFVVLVMLNFAEKNYWSIVVKILRIEFETLKII